MAELVEFDAHDFMVKSKMVTVTAEAAASRGLMLCAQELLRLSQLEVPLRKGYLMKTGFTKAQGVDTWVVGYRTAYAHRLHEHPEYKFGNGRKGKYLEDPLKHNQAKFQAIIAGMVNEVLK